jgi:hypothetical protein
MRPSIATHLVWALLVVVAFVVGLFVAGGSSESIVDSSMEERSVANRVRRVEVASAGDGQAKLAGAGVRPDAAAGIVIVGAQGGLSADEARALTFELLREPNRMERLSQLCEVLRRVTRENWRGVLDAFTRQTAFEGREHGDEWKLLLQRIGAVAEAEAVMDALNAKGANREHRARNTLEGWVAANPDAALGWVKTLPPEDRAVLDGAVIYALAGIAPVQALELALAQTDVGKREWAITELSKMTVQHGGFRQGEELLGAVVNRPDIDEEAKRRIFMELAQKRITMARVREQPMATLQWLDSYLSGETSPAGPTAVRQLVAAAAASDAGAALQWLDAHAGRLTSAQAVPAYTAALQAVYQKAPEQFTGWLSANQNHPAHDGLVEAYTNDLIAFGKGAEVGAWVNTVQDAATRQRIQSALERSERKNAPK